MRRSCYFLFFLCFFQFGFGSGHFVYIIKDDGVYGKVYNRLTKIEEADPETFEFIDASPSPYGPVVTYAKDKNRVYYYTTVVKDADPESFIVLEEWYVKDKNHVYNARNNHEIYKDYDATTFYVLENWFVKDKDGVYYEHNFSKEVTKIENTDPDSFEILWGTHYMKDRNQVYFYQEKDYGEIIIKILEDADPNTFVIKDSTSPYTKDCRNVYWNAEKLADAQAKTFKLIMRTAYGTDGKNVYYESKKLEDADPYAFTLLNRHIATTDKYVYFHGVRLSGLFSDNFTLGNKYYPYYIKNDSIVYYRSTRIKEADAATFKVTDGWGEEAEDKNHRYIKAAINKSEPILFGIYESGVYYRNIEVEKLPNADPNTFKILNKYYGKDKRTVYCLSYKVEGAEVATFELISESVGRDAVAVYHGKTKITGAAPNTYRPLNDRYGRDDKTAFFDDKTIVDVHLSSFQVINNLYAKDQNNVFFQTEIIKNADPETFEYVDYPFTKDKNNVYYETQKIESADAATFELFKDTYKDYSRDKDHVFYKNSIVSGADPETFEKFIGSNCWIDKNHVFINGEIIKNSHAPTFGYFHDKSAYSGDKNDIYYNNVGMNVDLPSFRILGKGFAIDKNHVYGDGKILEQYNIETFNIKAIH